MSDTLRRNSIYVSNLQEALREGEHGLKTVPGHIKKIIREEMWAERTVEATGQVAHFDSFSEFVAAPPPEGLGADVKMLKRMCDDDPDALRMLRAATTGEVGRSKGNTDNISNSSGHGTSKDYTLDRLARERPDLYEDVVQNRKSANAAAIEAGFRTKTVSVPVSKGGDEQYERAAESLAKHFSDISKLIDHLQRKA